MRQRLTFRPLASIWAALAALALLAAAAAPFAGAAPAAPSASRLGLSIEQRGDSLIVRSAGRFELVLDAAGISGWYDLQRDPGRTLNLVPAGRALVEHRGADGALQRAPWRVELANPAVVRVAWDAPGASRVYEIWAAGQVSIRTVAGAAPGEPVRRDEAITGATIQRAGPGEATLFLDAWTGEDRGDAAAGLAAWEGGASFDRATGLISAQGSSGAAQVRIPEGVGLRAPRFVVEGWPGPTLALRRGQTLLVDGQDYLAAWDAASRRLYVQVLAALPLGGDASLRSFTFQSLAQAGLSLGISGRTLDPSGLLQVDGNLPDGSGVLSTADLFLIPYIQDSPMLRPEAVYQGEGAGVEFVLSGGGLAEPRTAKVFGAAGERLSTLFFLPARGEYRLDGYLIDAGGARLGEVADSIAKLAYGRIFVTIGDSITAGVGSDAVSFGDPAYPVTSPERSPLASADQRTYFQFDNSNFTDRAAGVTSPFRRGYQLSLSDRLATCSAAPVFILNSGAQGLRTVRQSRNAKAPDLYAVPKLDAYVAQLQRLGARYVVIALGTNDVSDNLFPDVWAEQGLKAMISRIQSDVPGTTIWVPQIPYRKDQTFYRTLTATFNTYIDDVVLARDGQGGKVRLGPDFYTYFSQNQDQFVDNVHPNQAGYDAMTAAWGDAENPQLPCAVVQAEPPPEFVQRFLPLVRK